MSSDKIYENVLMDGVRFWLWFLFGLPYNWPCDASRELLHLKFFFYIHFYVRTFIIYNIDFVFVCKQK